MAATADDQDLDQEREQVVEEGVEHDRGRFASCSIDLCHEIVSVLRDSSKPLLAAIQGTAVGDGLRSSCTVTWFLHRETFVSSSQRSTSDSYLPSAPLRRMRDL